MSQSARTILLLFILGASAPAVAQPAEAERAAAAQAFLRSAQEQLCVRAAEAGESAADEYQRAKRDLECARRVLISASLLPQQGDAAQVSPAAFMAAAVANVDQNAQVVKEKAADANFIGFNWGLGIGYGFGQGPERITEAEVVNGIVRVKEDKTDGIRAVLEAHHFFDGRRGRFGWGPFASVQLGKDGASAVAFAVGLMAGWKDQGDKTSAGSWNIAVGYEFGQDVKVLGDGIEPNAPLPTGEAQVRYKTQPADALLVFFSRRFRMESID